MDDPSEPLGFCLWPYNNFWQISENKRYTLQSIYCRDGNLLPLILVFRITLSLTFAMVVIWRRIPPNFHPKMEIAANDRHRTRLDRLYPNSFSIFVGYLPVVVFVTFPSHVFLIKVCVVCSQLTAHPPQCPTIKSAKYDWYITWKHYFFKAQEQQSSVQFSDFRSQFRGSSSAATLLALDQIRELEEAAKLRYSNITSQKFRNRSQSAFLVKKSGI